MLENSKQITYTYIEFETWHFRLDPITRCVKNRIYSLHKHCFKAAIFFFSQLRDLRRESAEYIFPRRIEGSRLD